MMVLRAVLYSDKAR